MFKLGTKVEWSSQAQGSTKMKRGVVVRIVQPKQDVMDFWHGDLEATYKRQFDGGYPRDHESYLIAVEAKSKRGTPKLYWPKVKDLKAAM